MELDRALEIFEYNKDMLTCDMSIGRDPEHQDVSPDYYGKDAEDLYYAIVCVEKYIKNAIPVEWIEQRIRAGINFALNDPREGTTEVRDGLVNCVSGAFAAQVLMNTIALWRDENGTKNN